MLHCYAIGDHFEKLIRQQIESGQSASESEVVREDLRTLEAWVRLRSIEIEEYRIKSGWASKARALGAAHRSRFCAS